MTRRWAGGMLMASLLTLGATLVVPAPATAIDMNAVFPDLDLPGFKLTPSVA